MQEERMNSEEQLQLLVQSQETGQTSGEGPADVAEVLIVPEQESIEGGR